MRILTGALALTMVAGMAQAKTVWAVDNIRFAGELSDRIFKFDSANPVNSITQVGLTGPNTLFGGMDFDASGNLWLYAQTTGPGLYSANKTTGAASFVGTGGVAAGYSITDLSWNPRTGRMLGLGIQSTVVSCILYSIDLSTGVATQLDVIGGTNRLEVCLASNAGGQNYMLDLVANQMFELVGPAAIALPALLGYDANFSQGSAIDWSDTGMWGIGTINNGAVPLFNEGGEFRTVNANGSTNLISRIGPNDKLYECGDIAFEPSVDECADADFNGDNQVDFFDYLDFAAAFAAEDPSADFNGDNQIDFFDYLDFAAAFDTCSQ